MTKTKEVVTKRPNNPKYWAEFALHEIPKSMQKEYNLTSEELEKLYKLASEYVSNVANLIAEMRVNS